ncbi:MAG: hypothetical protein ACSHX4_10440 [Opitutaceae bacterium]
MKESNNIFAFEDGLKYHIYLAYGNFDSIQFEDFIDYQSKQIVPDKVTLHFHKGELSPENKNEVNKVITRRFHCKPKIIEINALGQTRSPKESEQFFELGLKYIIEKRKPVLPPPPGKSFAKPSGAKSKFFIQSSRMFVRHAEMSFLATLLIKAWGKIFDEYVNTIYVDTIDLYGLTSLAGRIRFGDKKHEPITVSFSSYTSYEEILDAANVEESLMVISATTTHKLLKKITTKTRWRNLTRVVTILDLDPKVHGGKEQVKDPIVISHVTPPESEPHVKLLPSIRLSGETFTIEADAPKSVTINAKGHSTCLKSLKLKELIKMKECFAACNNSATAQFPLFVDVNKLVNHSIFKHWLKNEISCRSPISTTHIIGVGVDERAISDALSTFPVKPKFLTPDDLENPTIRISGSVVVVCPCFSTGTRLLEISRDLRRHRNIKTIIYLTGIGTPESKLQLDKLGQNLRTKHNQLSSLVNIFIGSPETLGLSWNEELDFIKREGRLNVSKRVKNRLTQLNNPSLSSSCLLYESEHLHLHDKFRLWEGMNYPLNHDSSLFLLITFIHLLQSARSNNKLKDEEQLSPLPNRRVLLSPENFFRYNDSMLQAIILRSASPSEIDYSDHETHSKSITYLIDRAIQKEDFSITYELLIALATKRLKVESKELDKIKAIISQSELAECKWFKKTTFFRA